MEISLIAIDLAKSVFQVHAVSATGEMIFTKQLRRNQMLDFFKRYQGKGIKVVMEASCGAHYWARKLEDLGFKAGLLPAQKVKGFVTTQKNDKNDASAIAEAGQRPKIKWILPKTRKQLEMQSLLRARSIILKNRIQITNQIRGFALEFGITFAEGMSGFQEAVAAAIEDASNELTDQMRIVIRTQIELCEKLVEQEAFYTKQIDQYTKGDQDCQRLLEIPGVGPMIALGFLSHVGDAKHFKNGRAVAANLGIIPRQFSSAGRVRLGRITKRGDNDLRMMLMHGSRAVILAAMKKTHLTTRQEVLKEKVAQKGWGKVTVAQANYMCRVMWHVHRHKQDYKVA